MPQLEKVLLLQPTSPFRCLRHIQESENLLGENISSVVSVVEVSHHPISFFTLDGAFLRPYEGKNVEGIRRQDFPREFLLGTAQSTGFVQKTSSAAFLMGHSSVPYEMDAQFSINIDTEFDFTLAKLISENYG